jgi:hypothetical protein
MKKKKKKKAKAPIRWGRRVGHRVDGGGERGQGALRKISARKKCARDEARRREKGWRVWGQAWNLRTMGNRRRRPDRSSVSPSLSLSLSLSLIPFPLPSFLPSFFFSKTIMPWVSITLFSCAMPGTRARRKNLVRRGERWLSRNRRAKTSSLAAPSVSSSG